MKVTLLCTGKTSDKRISGLMELFEKRLANYCRFAIIESPDVKSSGSTDLKKKESSQILKYAGTADYLILLDEKGKEFSSIQFAEFISRQQLSGKKHVLFVTGGAYGFSDEVYSAAHEKISLSKLTFPHQLVRLFFVEQLYRAFTIIKNEPYHH